uniref:GTP cyclohydrolase 1 feedback regulatory protein n=1 Tax=Meloidogyne incognita TaxID=6306 RepID=A0A914MIL5_MELIC
MEHIFVSTQFRCETGPTVVGDHESNPELMALVEAKMVMQLGNRFAEYITEWTPRKVLDRLSELGFRVISSTGAGQTIIWTLGRERNENNNT